MTATGALVRFRCRSYQIITSTCLVASSSRKKVLVLWSNDRRSTSAGSLPLPSPDRPQPLPRYWILVDRIGPDLFTSPLGLLAGYYSDGALLSANLISHACLN